MGLMVRFSGVILMLLAGAAAAVNRLEVIDLPLGFAPEGITIGHPWEAYVGSIFDGSIWKGNLKTGEGEVVVKGPGVGMSVAGLAYDKRTDYLYVCGALSGMVRVYDRDFNLVLDMAVGATDGTSMINDVIIAKDFVYFTDSFRSQFYSISLGPGGSLPSEDEVVVSTIQLGPGFGFVEGGFNSNGIVASDDGSKLIIASISVATLYLVDSTTGHATAIDLGSASVAADGLLRRRNTLWAVSNGAGGTRPQEIVEISLSEDWTCGAMAERTLRSEYFNVPTTADRQYNGIYAVNSKFGTPIEDIPTMSYEIVRVDRDGGEMDCTAI